MKTLLSCRHKCELIWETDLKRNFTFFIYCHLSFNPYLSSRSVQCTGDVGEEQGGKWECFFYLGHCLRRTRNYCPLTGTLKLKTNRSKKAFSQIRGHTLLCILHSILQGVVSSVRQLRAALY